MDIICNEQVEKIIKYTLHKEENIAEDYGNVLYY